jgi:hypothetical protein
MVRVILNKLERLILHPYPHRQLYLAAMRRLGLGRYERRVELGAVVRPPYAYCVLEGARLAKRLGHSAISVIEFGVAGGNGLVNLEEHARAVQSALGVDVEVYGFDTAVGLPDSCGYRDLPYFWKPGFYKMDLNSLQSRLTSAKLVLGNLEETVEEFCDKYHPAPIGAIMFDLDYFSSTFNSFRLFEQDSKFFLPRIFCYFDDVIGTKLNLYNEYTGELGAIEEFNKTNRVKKSHRPVISCTNRSSRLGNDESSSTTISITQSTINSLGPRMANSR